MNASPVALITGSGRKRVGNVIAWSLGRAGYRVALHYYRSRPGAEETLAEMAAEEIEAAAYQADVADEAQVDRMFDDLLAHFGRLDVLATCASIWNARPLEETSAADMRRSYDVNTLGTFLCARRAGLIMAGQVEGGSIITFGDWAIRRPYPDYIAYFAAKGAVHTLTQTLAVELALRNPRVRVNCLHPGPVMFPPGATGKEQQQLTAATLVKRADDPESVAHAVRFLIDNPFITGACIPLDGGRTIYAGEA
ncbi:MAG: SDR family oxidoreductase [Planctomycetes bacterium]|nr:SDR family oxidoreductase [Planctomycetota bacterium]